MIIKKYISGKNPEDIIKPCWLKYKKFCYNPKHHLYNPSIDHIVRHLNSGKNVIIIVVGTPRTGKSWFSIWLAWYLNYCYFGRQMTTEDIYRDVDKFLEDTRKPENKNSFKVMEEQGVEQYAKDWWKKDIQGFDKITQIFGIDMTNIIINLPYLFDLFKGTRFKGHFLFRTYRIAKKNVSVQFMARRMSVDTTKAYWKKISFWSKVPICQNSKLLEDYEKSKEEYNLKKKTQILADIHGKNFQEEKPKEKLYDITKLGLKL